MQSRSDTTRVTCKRIAATVVYYQLRAGEGQGRIEAVQEIEQFLGWCLQSGLSPLVADYRFSDRHRAVFREEDAPRIDAWLRERGLLETDRGAYPIPQDYAAYARLILHLECPRCGGPMDDPHDNGLVECLRSPCTFTEGDCPRCIADLENYPPSDDVNASCPSCGWPERQEPTT